MDIFGNISKRFAKHKRFERTPEEGQGIPELNLNISRPSKASSIKDKKGRNSDEI